MKKEYVLIFLVALTIGVGISMRNIIFTNSDKTMPKIHMVSLLHNKAEPNVVTVKIGEHVQFNSKDGKKHHISSGAGKAYEESHNHEGEGIESGVFGPDEGYRIQFKKAGTYEFHDHTNPNIYITVVAYQMKDAISKK